MKSPLSLVKEEQTSRSLFTFRDSSTVEVRVEVFFCNIVQVIIWMKDLWDLLAALSQ